MIAAVALLLFAILAVGAASALSSAAWPIRFPGVAIWAWQTLSGAAALAVVLAGVAVGLPETPLSGTIADALGTSSAAVARHYSTPGGLPVAAVAIAVSVSVFGRFCYFLTRERLSFWRVRKRERARLRLVAVDHPAGYKLVRHDLPMVYCVPGWRPTVVVTSGAVDALTPHQFALVLAHERRHLRARHDLVLSTSGALARTFVSAGLFRQAHAEIGSLVEMQADDSAQQGDDRRALAAALLLLSPHERHVSAGIAGARSRVRIERLVRPSHVLLRIRGIGAAVIGVVVLGTPLALLLAPAVEATLDQCCPGTAGTAPVSGTQQAGTGGPTTIVDRGTRL